MLNVRIGDFTITEFVDVEAYFRGSGLLDYRLEDLSECQLNFTQEESDIVGRNGRVIGKKKKDKALEGSGTSGVISAGLFKTQTGGDIVEGTHKVKKSEAKPCVGKGTTIITNATAVGATGQEIGEIQVFTAGGRRVATFEQAIDADDSHFSYDPLTKTISLPNSNDIESGMLVLYAYEREITGTMMNDPSDKFSENRELWIHCFAKDPCDTIYCADIQVPRADFKGDFDLDLGGDQTTHNFSFGALPDFCNVDGSSDLCRIFVYTEDGAEPAAIRSNVFATNSEMKALFT